MIIATFLVSIVAGTAHLIYNSPFSPLLVAVPVLVTLSAFIWLRIPILALYPAVLVVLLPIGIIPTNIHSIFNRSLTVVAFVVWGVSVMVQKRRIIWTSTALFMFAFLMWGLLTVLWAQDLTVSKYVLGGYTLRFLLFLFLIPNEIRNQKNLDGLMGTLAIVGWIFLIAGVGTIMSQGYQVGTRLQILASNENTFGALFPIFLFGVIWLAVRTPNPHRKFWHIMSLVFMLLSFVLIALSGSRGGALSWVIMILGLLFWRQTRMWGIAGIVILMVALILAPLILSTTIERFMITTGDTLLGGREALWQAAWLLIQDHPLRGVGVGNGPYENMSYIRLFRSIGNSERAVMHNPILTIWAETGLPGLLLYLGVLVSSVWSFTRQYIRCRKMEAGWLMPYLALTVAAFLGYFVSWIKGGGMELGYSYFLLLALLLVPSHIDMAHPNFISD
jgi:O-antigen ligase